MAKGQVKANAISKNETKQTGGVKKGKINQIKEMFPNTQMNDQVIQDSIRGRGANATADLILTGQIQQTQWITVPKKRDVKEMHKHTENKENERSALRGKNVRGSFPKRGGGRMGTKLGGGFNAGQAPPRGTKQAEQNSSEIGGVIKINPAVPFTKATSAFSYADVCKVHTPVFNTEPQPSQTQVQSQTPPSTLTNQVPINSPWNRKAEQNTFASVSNIKNSTPVFEQTDIIKQEQYRQPDEYLEEEEELEDEEELNEPEQNETENIMDTQELEKEEEEEEERKEETDNVQPEYIVNDVVKTEEKVTEKKQIWKPKELKTDSPIHSKSPPKNLQPETSAIPVHPPRQNIAYRPPQANIEKIEQKRIVERMSPDFRSEETVLLPPHLQERCVPAIYSFGSPEDYEDITPSTQEAQTEPFIWSTSSPTGVQAIITESLQLRDSPKASLLHSPTKHPTVLETSPKHHQPAARLMQPQSPVPPQKPQQPRQPQPLPAQPHAPTLLNVVPVVPAPQLTRPSETVVNVPTTKTIVHNQLPVQSTALETNSTPSCVHPMHHSPATSPVQSSGHTPSSSPAQRPAKPSVAPPNLHTTPTTANVNTSHPSMQNNPEQNMNIEDYSYMELPTRTYSFDHSPEQQNMYHDSTNYSNEWEYTHGAASRGTKMPFHFHQTQSSTQSNTSTSDKGPTRGNNHVQMPHKPPLAQHVYPLPYSMYPCMYPMYGPPPPQMDANSAPGYDMDYTKMQGFDPSKFGAGYGYMYAPPWVPYGAGPTEPSSSHKYPTPSKPSSNTKFSSQQSRGGRGSFNNNYQRQWQDNYQTMPYFPTAYPGAMAGAIPGGFTHLQQQQGPQ